MNWPTHHWGGWWTVPTYPGVSDVAFDLTSLARRVVVAPERGAVPLEPIVMLNRRRSGSFGVLDCKPVTCRVTLAVAFAPPIPITQIHAETRNGENDQRQNRLLRLCTFRSQFSSQLSTTLLFSIFPPDWIVDSYCEEFFRQLSIIFCISASDVPEISFRTSHTASDVLMRRFL